MHMLSNDDITAILLTLKLALITTAILLVLGLPLAWWLARSRSFFSTLVASVVALPLVLPPTVIGFYLLIMMGPNGWLGKVTQWLGMGLLPFTFEGLIIASVVYSLPLVVQPLQNAMAMLDQESLDAASTLGASPLDRFFTIVLPLIWPGLLTAAVMGFAHTLGEFGVVLMIGGNISDETRVVAIQIYDQVETLNYANAHYLSAVMILVSLVILVALNLIQRRSHYFRRELGSR